MGRSRHGGTSESVNRNFQTPERLDGPKAEQPEATAREWIQDGRTVYQLNIASENRFYFTVYPGTEDSGKRTPDTELERIAAEIVTTRNAHDDLVAACDPEMLEAIADEIQCFEHSARSHAMRLLATKQRAALAKAGVKA